MVGDGGGRSSGALWMVLSVGGLVAWVGATIVVAATGDNPSDATPVLRAHAVGGALYFGSLLTAAGVQVHRRSTRAGRRLYERLALAPVPPATLRAATRGTRGAQAVYLGFTAATTGLVLTAIGLGPDGPTRALYYGAAALVVVWTGVMVAVMARAYRSSDDVLGPLGLAVTTLPSWLPPPLSAGGSLVGELGFAGERHDREVSIAHRPELAVTSIRGRFVPRTMSSATAMAALTGEPPSAFRRVEVRVTSDSVTVRRTGNGAGRHIYRDLLLAEHLADAAAAQR
jgi:hypothetical protein